MKRSVLQLFCIVCLLLGQQAAFTHASWHAHEQSLRQHGNHHKQPSTQGDLCKLHGVFTQLVGTAPGSIVHFALTDALDERSTHRPTLAVSAGALTPRSRGPPRLS